jgi:hypothetical protein
MNKPEKLSLIVGGSIIGGLALGFAGYKWYKSKQAAKMDIEALRNRYVGEEILDPNAKDNNTENSDYDSALVFEDDDDDVSFTSSTGGGKKKKSRRQKKKKSKNNRKRHSKKRKKSRK